MRIKHCFNISFFAVFFLVFSLTATAQKKDTVVTYQKRILLPDTMVEKALVDLAMKNPTVEEARHENRIAEYQLKTAKKTWTNLLTLSANYNDQTFSKNPNTNFVYPKYFFGLNIPLGTLLSKTPVKAANEQVEISKQREIVLARNVKAEVLGKYKQYRALMELISNQKQVVDDYQASFMEAKKKFGDGTITIEEHNRFSKSYNDEQAVLINLQLQQDMLRLDIEKIIGVNLESVMYTTN